MQSAGQFKRKRADYEFSIDSIETNAWTGFRAADFTIGRNETAYGGQHPEFEPRTLWMSNAFTSAFKDLDPIPQFRATAKLGSFLDTCFKKSY